MGCRQGYVLRLACVLLYLDLADRVEFTQAHPEHVANDNAMKFLSDDGGESYNKCHCTSFLSFRPSSLQADEQSGQISKSETLTSGVLKPTWTSSTSSTKRVDSTTRDGEMLPSTLSALRYSQINPRFTGLTILDTVMNRSSIVHRVKHMLGASVGVISTTTLIGSGTSFLEPLDAYADS